MHFLIYTSAATALMGDDALSDLLAQCRTRNLAEDVTGMLLYKDGSFMQALEGSRDTIFRTYDRIGRDPRHKNLTLLRDRAIPARSFDGWSMGFRSLDAADLSRIPGYAHLSGDTFSTAAYGEDPHMAVRLLRTFHETTR